MLYASVHILNAPYHIDKPYTYHLPLELEEKVKVGSVVVVPFGGANKQRTAVVTEISDKSECKTTKPVLGVPGKYMYIGEEMLELCKYMKEHLFCSLGDAVSCVLPAGLGVKSVRMYKRNPGTKELDELNYSSKAILAFLGEGDYVSETELVNRFGSGTKACVKALEKLGLCVSEEGFECRINEKNEKYAVLSDNEEAINGISDGTVKLTAKQESVFEALLHYESPCPVTELCEISGAGVSVINELEKKGVISLIKVNKDRNKAILENRNYDGYGKDFDLSPMQQKAYDTLLGLYEKEKAAASLLYGVTGSGKTNVILKLISKVVDDGKNAIVLVPEIALTGQTVGRFSAIFGDKIALIHSGLSAGERTDAHKAIIEGRAKIVIGTRSAVFAPLKNVGLIVIDEEQESSFKSDKSPKYHARDVARFRCAYNNALLVLASATPSIESFYKAKIGRYTLVSLTERYGNAKLPKVLFHDMRNEPYFEVGENEDKNDKVGGGVPTTIGSTLEAELADNFAKGEQSVLFINRRGYRSFAQCHSCGYTFQCPNCSVTLTHHRNKLYGRDTMTCHYCGYSTPLPEECPVCKKSDSIVYMGAGTQLLESQIKEKFPKIRVLRMDADTTGGKFSHEEILESFRNHEADVLLGTQMVAKGHDFPDVSLVGVINADISLYSNDFKANEKTFSLLTQVLGRSGRGEKEGRAVIQTYSPDNDVLLLSSEQDYTAFYEREILFRKASVFPPFCDIITLTFSGEVERDVQNAVKEFGKSIDDMARNKYSDVKFILYGPFQNDIYKISGRYRMRFIIKCKNNSRLRKMLSELISEYMAGLKGVNISADVNPSNL